MICGIPDFRLLPDPYIGIAEDRAKGERLASAGESRSFEQLVRYYYEITPEDPSDLAKHWIARTLAEVAIARFTLATYHLSGERLLDLGCSTGAMLAAAEHRFAAVTGVDVAFRWLVIGAHRLRELGVEATLVCANAEFLPFAAGSFDAVTAVDLLEHVADAQKSVNETRRVAQTAVFVTNNRYAPLPDPQVRIWGVGLLPRAWQARYVASRRGDLHPYRVSMRSARELGSLCDNAGFREIVTAPARLYAPHLHGGLLRLALGVYNAVRTWPGIRGFLKLAGPKLVTKAVR